MLLFLLRPQSIQGRWRLCRPTRACSARTPHGLAAASDRRRGSNPRVPTCPRRRDGSTARLSCRRSAAGLSGGDKALPASYLRTPFASLEAVNASSERPEACAPQTSSSFDDSCRISSQICRDHPGRVSPALHEGGYRHPEEAYLLQGDSSYIAGA
jgi:hypothetical protein